MMLSDSLGQFFSEYGFARTYYIGFSGGLDSQVLLSLCYELRQQLPLNIRALHINHGLNPQAKEWALRCALLCEQYVIPFEEHVVHIENNKGNLEETARNARYTVFAEKLTAGDLLLTAHHQDDQAETMLLQLLRGAGPKGLAAMPMIKPFASGFHARPLLKFSRAVLEKYAHDKKLTWINDESNQDIKLTRNLIRHQILPKLKIHFVHANETLARSANHCAEMQMLLDEYAQVELQSMQGSQPLTLSVDKLRLLTPSKQRLMLRTWIVQRGLPLPDTKKLMTIQHQMTNAARDKNPAIIWADVIVRRYQDDLYLMPASRAANLDVFFEQQHQWLLAEPLPLPGVGVLQATASQSKGLHPQIKKVTVCFRKGGEVINTSKRGHRCLKKLLQEWGVKPWERERIPLVYFKEKLIAVIGYAMDPDYMVKNDDCGYELTVIKEKIIP